MNIFSYSMIGSILNLVLSSLFLPVATSFADQTLDTNFPQLVKEIGDAHAALLKSGSCQGRLRIVNKGFDQEVASTLVDCDFRVDFDGPKIRLERIYHVNKLTKAHQPGAWGLEPAGYTRHVLISNEDDNYWARFDDQGRTSCFVLNRQWCDRLLCNIDSPAPHPIRLWENAVSAFPLEALEFNVGRLAGNGLFAKGEGRGFSVECYLLPPEPLCLKRLVLRDGHAAEIEHMLQWAESNGVKYVKEYSRSIVERTSVQRREFTTTIKVSDFQVNAKVEPETFELSSLGIPDGTEFRANAPVPMRYIFDGAALVRQNRQ